MQGHHPFKQLLPKDEFPLPRIDKLVDAVAIYEMLSLPNYFSRYHHIWMAPEDEDRTSFITSSETYCFIRMAEEGLQNARPTFSAMTKNVFESRWAETCWHMTKS